VSGSYFDWYILNVCFTAIKTDTEIFCPYRRKVLQYPWKIPENFNFWIRRLIARQRVSELVNILIGIFFMWTLKEPKFTLVFLANVLAKCFAACIERATLFLWNGIVCYQRLCHSSHNDSGTLLLLPTADGHIAHQSGKVLFPYMQTMYID